MHAQWCAAGISDDLAPRPDPAHPAVREDDSAVGIEETVALHGMLDRLTGLLSVIRMYPRQERLEARLEPVWLEAEEPVQLGRPGDGVGADLPLPAAQAGQVLRVPQLALRLEEGSDKFVLALRDPVASGQG
jgi:hypothetical protein